MMELQDFFSLVQDASVVDGDLLSWVCVLSLALLCSFSLEGEKLSIFTDFILAKTC